MIVGCCHNVQLSITVLWLPGVGVFILERIIGVPHELALSCVNPLRVFAFFCFTGTVLGGMNTQRESL